MTVPMSPRRILVFKHMSAQNPGIFRDFADDLCVEFTEIDLYAGDQIPPVDGFDGLWVMGGSMNVWETDQYPWLVEERKAIRHAVVDLELPFLGVCLGHQLLSEAMGGVVEPAQHQEVVLATVTPTAAGIDHPILRGLDMPMRWVSVHSAEVVRAPPGAVVLASSDVCSNHVMQVGPLAYSCQFHPEVCGTTLSGWMDIPGVPAMAEQQLGAEGVEAFARDVTSNMAAHNEAALQLFINWCELTLGPSELG